MVEAEGAVGITVILGLGLREERGLAVGVVVVFTDGGGRRGKKGRGEGWEVLKKNIKDVANTHFTLKGKTQQELLLRTQCPLVINRQNYGKKKHYDVGFSLIIVHTTVL